MEGGDTQTGGGEGGGDRQPARSSPPPETAPPPSQGENWARRALFLSEEARRENAKHLKEMYEQIKNVERNTEFLQKMQQGVEMDTSEVRQAFTQLGEELRKLREQTSNGMQEIEREFQTAAILPQELGKIFVIMVQDMRILIERINRLQVRVDECAGNLEYWNLGEVWKHLEGWHEHKGQLEEKCEYLHQNMIILAEEMHTKVVGRVDGLEHAVQTLLSQGVTGGSGSVVLDPRVEELGRKIGQLEEWARVMEERVGGLGKRMEEFIKSVEKAHKELAREVGKMLDLQFEKIQVNDQRWEQWNANFPIWIEQWWQMKVLSVGGGGPAVPPPQPPAPPQPPTTLGGLEPPSSFLQPETSSTMGMHEQVRKTLSGQRAVDRKLERELASLGERIGLPPSLSESSTAPKYSQARTTGRTTPPEVPGGSKVRRKVRRKTLLPPNRLKKGGGRWEVTKYSQGRAPRVSHPRVPKRPKWLFHGLESVPIWSFRGANPKPIS